MDVELRHLRAFTAVATHRSSTAVSRELRLGFPWVPPDPWATETITGFEQASGARVTLLGRDDIAAALGAGDLDVAITRTRLATSGTVQAPLFDEDRVAAVSTRSPLADEDVIDWPALAAEPIVVNTVNGTTRPDSWPAEHRPTRVVTCGNYDERLQLVVTGRGVGAVPGRPPAPAPTPGVAFVPLAGAPPVSVCLAHRPRRSSPLVRRFVTFAAATAAPAHPR
jgi:DNA-binding transcriptional LysR family regulator